MGAIKNIVSAGLEVCENAGMFLQSSMWGEFKSSFGWKSGAFLVDWAGQGEYPLLTLSRRFAPSGFSFSYIPWGPALPPCFSECERSEALAELAVKLKPFLSKKTVFLRFDLPWYDDNGAPVSHNETACFLSAGLKRAAAPVQAPDTVLVNLVPSNVEILSAMKPKWRYNISLAAKKGVQVETLTKSSGGTPELEIFYGILRETAKRDGFAIHSFDYYKTLFEKCAECSKDAKVRLYTAAHEGEILAGIMVLFSGKYATYLYGASSGSKRNLMAPYALQWKAMQDAKEAGCLYYDLFGIPPDENSNHEMAGLYRFKTGFGGKIIHRPGCWDYPYKPLFYRAFNFAEALRKKLRDRKKKKI